jgi:hypothetical protein
MKGLQKNVGMRRIKALEKEKGLKPIKSLMKKRNGCYSTCTLL